MSFEHVALGLENDKKIVFTALSKHFFYFRKHICQYVLTEGAVPLNPFMVFDYFLLDTVDRDVVRSGNNTLLKRSDELWVFGDISNGVLAEIKMAKALGKPIKYFAIKNSQNIVPINMDAVTFEDEVRPFASDFFDEQST